MPFAELDFSGREYRITKIFQYNIYYGQIVTIALQSELTNDTTRTNVEVIAVAMSGGVDSSVVAALMQEQSRTVIGLTMQLWNQRRLLLCNLQARHSAAAAPSTTSTTPSVSPSISISHITS